MSGPQSNSEQNMRASFVSSPVYYEEDEIDLYELWLTLKKRRKVVLLTTFLFFFLACIYVLFVSPVYEANFILKQGEISSFQIEKYVDNLSYLLKEERYKDLSKGLKLDISKVKLIKDIKASIPRRQQEIVQVTLQVFDPSIIPSLENSIVDYISSQPEIVKIISVKRKELISTINNLNKQISSLKKLQSLSLEKRDINLDPLKIQMTIKEYEDEIVEDKAELALLKPLYLAVPAIIPQKPAKPKKALIISVSLVSGLFLGTFLAFFFEWLDQARKRYEEVEG